MAIRDFAKIFKIGELQVLYYVEYDHDHEKDEMGILHQMIQDDEINFDMKAKNISVENAFKLFDGMNEEIAAKLIKMYEEVMAG